MSRTVATIIFVSIVALVVCGLHFYLWARFVRDTAVPPPWRTVATIAVVLLAVGLPLSFILVRLETPNVFKIVAYPIYFWMGLIFLLFALLLCTDLIKLATWAILRLSHGPSPFSGDPGRRAFIARLVAGAVAAGALTAGVIGLRNALARVRVRRLGITLKRLPRALDSFTIVQLTDLHLGAPLGRQWLEEIVETVNALKPRLVAITGDLVDGPVEVLRETVAPLAQLEAPEGVFFVTGNHEYYSGAEEWIAHLKQLRIRVLCNERVSIGEGAAVFDLAGINDHEARRMGSGHEPDLQRALKGRDPEKELVLLAHQPRAVLEAAEQGVGLQLSGHTHGGQLWPMHYLVRLQQPYISGLVQHGPTQLYVSEGTGFWGPPMRLGSRSEITLIELRAAG